MKKENKIWLPVVIILGVLVIALFAGGFVVKNTIGQHELKKGSGEVEVPTTTGDQNLDGDNNEFEMDAISQEATLTVEVISRLENPDTYIIDDNPLYSYYDSTLEGLTAEELFYAWNEIYAKDGAVFDDPKVQAYFDSKSWYVKGDKTPDQLKAEYEAAWFNQKQYNVDFIKQYMIDNNLVFTP